LFREESTETISAAVTSQATSGSAPANTYGTQCAAVRIYTDTAVWVKIAKAPVAVANTCMYVPAGAIEFFYADLSDKVAVLEA
jgi:hypothetical protein